MEEIWKPVIGYEGLYSISNTGKVRSDIKRNKSWIGKILKPHKCGNLKKPYHYIYLCKNRIRKHRQISHLVAEHFIGPRPKGYQINHIDGGKLNNNIDNLEYITNLENIQHSWRIGLREPHKGVRGSKSNFAKLTEKNVLEIRQAYVPRKITMIFLAKKFNVCENCINKIINRKTWNHI